MVGYWEGSLRELSLRIVIVRLNLDFSHGDKNWGTSQLLMKEKMVNNFGGYFSDNHYRSTGLFLVI